MKNKKIRQNEDEEIHIDINKTVDELLKCWDSRIKYQNYMRQIDEMVLGKERDEEFTKETQYIEVPEIRFRGRWSFQLDDLDNNFKACRKPTNNLEENMFKSSLQKNYDNISKESQNFKKKISSNHLDRNDPQSNSGLNNNDDKNNSYENDTSNDAKWNDKPNRKNMTNKKPEVNANKRYSQDK